MKHVAAASNDNPLKKRKGKRFLKLGSVILGVLAIFWLGIMVGNGRITIGPDAALRKSVQKNLPPDLDYASVERVYDALRVSYDGQLDVNKLLDGLKQGLAEASGDPYTEYFNAEAAKKFNEQLNGTFSGVGAELGKDADNNLIIVAPIAGFPAEKAGLRAKDIIVEVDGDSTINLSISEAVNRIRGPKGTSVTLKVIRGQSQALSFTIIRDNIKIPSVKSEILAGNIGYLQITEYSDDTARLAKEAAAKFKQANVHGVILDVRGNPGGYLDAAVDLSSLWLSNKTVLTERRGGIVVQTFKSQGSAPLAGIPTVVLIDEGSASASEITAGALRDNKAATLIGVTSFGKGSVQDIQDLQGGAQIKVTIARWYTPSGKNIDKQGIKPDQEVKRSDADIKADKDPQLDAATAFLKK